MFFHRKIYFNNKPLWLTNNAPRLIEEQPIVLGYLRLEGAFTRNFKLAKQHLSNPRSLGAVIEDISETTLTEHLYEHYQPIDAGGGVVLNETGAVLMIYRRGKWDLPKGKADAGESIAHCAVREVEEETGLKGVHLGAELCRTYHVYTQDGEDLLKCTTWYKMQASSKQSLTPQAQENILKAEWIAPEYLPEIMNRSYEAVKETLQVAGLMA